MHSIEMNPVVPAIGPGELRGHPRKCRYRL
jgi:hypothetical protein